MERDVCDVIEFERILGRYHELKQRLNIDAPNNERERSGKT